MTCDLCDKKEISSEFFCPFCDVFFCSQECLDNHMDLYGRIEGYGVSSKKYIC